MIRTCPNCEAPRRHKVTRRCYRCGRVWRPASEPKMQRLATIIFCMIFGFIVIGLILCVSGCGQIEIYDPDTGNLIGRETSLLKSPSFDQYQTHGTTITRGASAVDDAAVKAIVEGVVAGLAKGVVP